MKQYEKHHQWNKSLKHWQDFKEFDLQGVVSFSPIVLAGCTQPMSQITIILQYQLNHIYIYFNVSFI